MALNQETVNGKTIYVFDSSNIKVYPCSSRGIQSANNSWDPEARLNTEKNFVGIGGKNSTYISDWKDFYNNDSDANSHLICYLNGYRIDIDKFNLYTLTAAGINPTTYHLYIVLKEINLVGSYNTNVLGNCVNSSSELDINSKFQGVALVANSDLANLTTYYNQQHNPDCKLYSIKLLEANGSSFKLISSSFEATVIRGSGENAFVLNYPKGKDNISNIENSANGDYSVAEGYHTQALGHYCHTEGKDTTANGYASHAEGAETVADAGQNGFGAHAEGYHTVATGGPAHAEGKWTIANGNGAHAEGIGNNDDRGMAYGTAAHSEGYETVAGSNYAHAEGQLTKVWNTAGHAEGYKTTVNGAYSHAEGQETTAAGTASHVEGIGTMSSGDAQHVVGKYNVANGTLVEIVGQGTDDNNRKNIRTLDTAGNETLAGNLNVVNVVASGSISAGTTLTATGGLSGASLNIGSYFSVTNAGNVTATTYNATSDARLKENVKTFIPEHSILDLDIKEFDFIGNGSHHIGCIAQELQEICPEIVHEEDNGYLSIEETKIVYLLLDEVKKLKKEVEELKRK